MIPVQSPKAPPLEQWDPGVPVARVEADQPAWSWKGGWSSQTLKNEWSSWKVRQAGGAGDEATLAFEGTGVAIVGTMSQEGGRADVYLDGAKAGLIDAWIPERTNDNDYWHVTGLANGPHTVRLVVRGRRGRAVEGSARSCWSGRSCTGLARRHGCRFGAGEDIMGQPAPAGPPMLGGGGPGDSTKEMLMKKVLWSGAARSAASSPSCSCRRPRRRR